MKVNMSVLLLSALVASGCTSVEFNKTGSFAPTATSKNCDFKVYEQTPTTAFEEIGTIKLVDYPECLPKTTADVKDLVKKEVCQNGGNGFILGATNDKGGYEEGVVIHTK